MPYLRNLQQLDVLFLGPTGNTHLSGSFKKAADRMGLESAVSDTAPAYSGSVIAQRLLWHLGDRRPIRLNAFCADLVSSSKPRVLLALGLAPLKAQALLSLKSAGVTCYNFLTDDPFNPVHRSSWGLAAISKYDAVFTPRNSNIDDLKRLGCSDIRYLPFAYDDTLFTPQNLQHPREEPAPEVLFVGGADADRARFFSSYVRFGPKPVLVGGFWDRYRRMRPFSLGLKSAECIADFTARTAVNICLVRRANRDGHVMRSFEIPAVGGFMIAEDTADHRDFFGEEGVCVLYFKTPEEAAKKAAWAIAHKSERQRMAKAAHHRIVMGRNTYRDRLQTILG